MQKISLYLYSNRISLVANLAAFPVEFRTVYQRRIKLYKGMKNIVEFDIKNADQKRIDISGYTLKCVILDVHNMEVLTLDIEPILSSPGIATMTVLADDIAYIKPQFLKYTVYILNNDGTKSPLYGDTQFGLSGQLDLLTGALPEEQPPQIIDHFVYLQDDTTPGIITRTYFSDSVEINPKNDISDNSSINLNFLFNNLDANVTVQVTTDSVVSTGTVWSSLETFIVTNTTETMTKIYSEIEDYSNNIGWLRIKYVPDQSNTGKIDKVLVKM